MTVGSLRWSPGDRLGERSVAVAAVLAAVAIGVAVGFGPLGAIGAGIAIAAAILLVLGRRIVPVFLGALCLLLIGYAFLGRGIAHVSVGPAYIGEIVFVLAIPALIVSLGRARITMVHVLLLLFMLWGAAQTIPYLGLYGLDAVRDAVTWGYAVFAFAVSFALSPDYLPAVVRIYRRIAFPLVISIPIIAVLAILFGDVLPKAPGSDVPIVDFKAGDASVHLAGIAAFVLLGLYGWKGWRSTIDELRLWLFWLVSFALGAALTRGGMIAASMAALSALFLRRVSRWLAPLLIALLLFTGAWLVNPRVDLGLERSISFDQIAQNVVSIFTNQGGTQTEATKEWRLAWWDKIIGYTIDGPYFWTGKGYGVNLAHQDGFADQESTLRAPHSTHFEILARSGVPGLVLWIVLQVAFAISMLVAARQARRRGAIALLAMIGWVFVYWVAALVNASFDVYIGGPQGGIWFWSLMGLGIVLCRLAGDETSSDPDLDPSPARDGGAPARSPQVV